MQKLDKYAFLERTKECIGMQDHNKIKASRNAIQWSNYLRCGCKSDDDGVHQPRWRCAKGLAACGLDRSLAHRSQLQYSHNSRPTTTPRLTHRYHANTANMRTYDDSFSGQKIYPGKVRYNAVPCPDIRLRQRSTFRHRDTTKRTPGGG
jgi:hypothetical protein